MSTVKADNFTWKSGQSGGLTGTNVTGDQIVYGVAKAWINYTTVTTTSSRGSFNVSGLTDNGTGNTTIAFTNSFIDTNYVISGVCSGPSIGQYGRMVSAPWGSISTSSVGVGTSLVSAGTITAEDELYISIIINR